MSLGLPDVEFRPFGLLGHPTGSRFFGVFFMAFFGIFYGFLGLDCKEPVRVSQIPA